MKNIKKLLNKESELILACDSWGEYDLATNRDLLRAALPLLKGINKEFLDQWGYPVNLEMENGFLDYLSLLVEEK